MKKVRKSSKFIGMSLAALSIVAVLPTMASAHCDTMDGPTIGDGKKALENNNVNYVLKWVKPESEKEIDKIFEQTMEVRKLSPESKELADKYFYENLVRIHRAGEGASFEGVKPSGTPVDEVVLAADKSIEVGNLSPLEKLVPEEKMPELKERFEKVMASKDFDVNDVEAGREYIEAYVSFFHFAEGEEEGHAAEDNHDSHVAEAKHGQNEESHNNNPKTGDVGIIPFAAASTISGLGALALGLKRRSK